MTVDQFADLLDIDAVRLSEIRRPVQDHCRHRRAPFALPRNDCRFLDRPAIRLRVARRQTESFIVREIAAKPFEFGAPIIVDAILLR